MGKTKYLFSNNKWPSHTPSTLLFIILDRLLILFNSSKLMSFYIKIIKKWSYIVNKVLREGGEVTIITIYISSFEQKLTKFANFFHFSYFNNCFSRASWLHIYNFKPHCYRLKLWLYLTSHIYTMKCVISGY